MTWNKDYRLYAIKVHTVGMSAAAYVSGLQGAGIRANSDIQRETTAGNVYSASAYLLGLRASASFETFDLARAIDNLGLGESGACIESDGTHPGIEIYYAKYACNGPAAGSVHRKYTIGKGIIVPRSLRAAHRSNASLAYELYAAYDGTNNPVVMTDNVALPSGSADTGYRWAMSTASIGGVTVEGKQDISIDFNARVEQRGADSDIYDSVVSLAEILPTIRFAGTDPTWFTTVAPLAGKTVQDTNSSFVLLRRGNTLSDAVNVRFAFSGMVNWDTVIEGNSREPASASLAIDTHMSSLGNSPIVVNTAYGLP